MKDAWQMQCHEIDYEIFGADMQMVEVELDPGETVIAEAGAMNCLEEGIDFEAKMGDGSTPHQGMMGKLLGALPSRTDLALVSLVAKVLFCRNFGGPGWRSLMPEARS